MSRTDLVPDCGSCAAVCCVAPSFEVSDDFAFSKPAGVRCPNLRADQRCGIHDELRVRGFVGCSVYGCHGAGQRVTREYGAQDAERERNDAFMVLRVVHELLWLLTHAIELCPPAHAELAAELGTQIAVLDALACKPVADLRELAVSEHEAAARALLRRVGDAIGGRRGVRRTLPVLP
jgi:hypothetical protein